MDPAKALADAERKPYWLDEDPAEPDPQPRLFGRTTADLAIVGGGVSGLGASPARGPPSPPTHPTPSATASCSKGSASAGPPQAATAASATPA